MDSNAPTQVKPTPTTSFTVGEHVKWKDTEGFVNFICDEYITICVCSYTKDDPYCLHKTEKVCVLCFKKDWMDVEHEGQK